MRRPRKVACRHPHERPQSLVSPPTMNEPAKIDSGCDDGPARRPAPDAATRAQAPGAEAGLAIGFEAAATAPPPSLDADTPPLRPVPDLAFPPTYCRGTSSAMTALYEQMQALRKGRLPVLIHGETGVGKELIARILRDSSDRAGGPFVAINCAAIPQDLLEAEMFGVARGVATGVEKRAGVFQEAAGGTLFLDEIGELAAALQPKLLRVLQEKEIRPLGGRPRSIDVWVIAATNAALGRRLADQGLRRDLYYRLAGGVLEVPPLRRRRGDIPGLAKHFLRRHGKEAGVRLRGVTAGAVDRLRAYHWPGNVRELEHEMQRLAYQSHDGAVIDAASLDPRIRSPRPRAESAAAELDSLELAPRVAALERSLIREALRRCGGRQVDAARLLGISRNGLAKKLKRLDLKETWALQDGGSPGRSR